MKAMIFAAGLGTRLKPLTNTIPKAMVAIAGKPLLEHLIIKLKNAGFNEIIINVHHFPDQIIDFLHSKNNFDIRIEISDERNQLLDTGGAIRKAAWFFDDHKPFLVHNVDILSNLNLKEFYQAHTKTNAIASLLVSKRKTERLLLFDKSMQLKAWQNIKTGEIRPESRKDVSELEEFAFAGIHILSPSVFNLMQPYETKFSIIDFYLSEVENKRINGWINNNLQMLDVGKLNVLDLAEKFIQET